MSTALDIQAAAASVQRQLAQGTDRDDVVRALQTEGWSEPEAQRIVERVSFGRSIIEPERQQRKREETHKAQMAGGALMLIGGLAFTIWSFTRGGDTVWIAWGAILMGALLLIQGFVSYVQD